MENVRLFVSRKRVMQTLLLIAVVLVALSVTGQIYRYTIGRDRYLVRLFNLDVEWNFPSVYNTTLLLFSACLFACIAWFERQGGLRFRRRWWGLAGLFFIASLDELMSFHEQLSSPVRAITGADGFLHYAWLLPAFLLLAILLVMYLPLFISLSSPFKMRFGGAAVLYLLGAVGLEMIGGKILDSLSIDSLSYSLETQAEEILEWAGLLLLVDSLFFYIAGRFGSIPIEVALKPVESRPDSGKAIPP